MSRLTPPKRNKAPARLTMTRAQYDLALLAAFLRGVQLARQTQRRFQPKS